MNFTPGKHGDYVIGYPMLGVEGYRKHTEDMAAVAIARVATDTAAVAIARAAPARARGTLRAWMRR